jgi:hypothetical protein
MKTIEIEIDKNYSEKIIIQETEKGTFWISLFAYMDDMALEVKKEHIEQLKTFLNEL